VVRAGQATDVDAARVLLEALRGRRFDAATAPEPTPRLVAAADYHGVVLVLRRAYGPASAVPRIGELKAAARRLRALSLRIAHTAVEVSGWLEDASVRHAVIKGPAVAVAYPDEDREFVDLDVLVGPGDMARAIHELGRHGAVVLEPEGWPRTDGIGELALGLPSGVVVDLHADLVHHEDVRRRFSFPAEPLLQRAISVPMLGGSILALNPEDSCTYVALHAAISGGDRLVWLADLDALVRQDQIQWATLIEHARQARLALVVGVMLQRTAAVLGTPVPQHALKALLRNGLLWSTLLATFEHFRPIARSHGQILRGQVLMRSTRSSTASSMVQLARLIWTDVTLFVLRNSNHPWRSRVRTWRRGLTARAR